MTLEQCWHAVPGGTAVAALELARELHARDDVEVVGVAARHSSPPPADWTPPIAVRHLWAPRPVLYELWHARLPGVDVERATGPVDVVHGTAVAFPRAAAPVVMTIHDLAFLTDPSTVTRHGLRFFRRGTELARTRAGLVLCSSRATMDECVIAGFDESKLRLVPLGVRVDPASDDDVARAQAAYGIERPYVLFTGTVEPRKNLPRLLRAFARLDRTDVDLVLVGPSGWKESLHDDLGAIESRVRMTGFVGQRDRDALVAGARAFCYPSLKEGFGLPVLEAMAQGTPVVTSRGTSTEEVAGDAALLIDPKDEGSIAQAIESILDDHALADRLSNAGRARAATFTWERTAEAVVAAYREAAA
ncbi:MAG TPA: glycosyltransferase family 1 protein [Acidimicrobiales bacterium]|jgi:glycosyltransferase involved in cell wall biosynthesis|nr:glycosyltransferase family 1 protein [Acidimicrobiales bacterium]